MGVAEEASERVQANVINVHSIQKRPSYKSMKLQDKKSKPAGQEGLERLVCVKIRPIAHFA
jgi:hypothetical protein